MADAIRVEGLADLRKSLRQVDRDSLKVVQAVTRGAAQMVAADARSRAPRRSGALQASIKGTTSGNKGIVRSTLPYARVHEWGGQISPKGAPITIERSRFVGKALESKSDEVMRALEVGFDQAARRAGWK